MHETSFPRIFSVRERGFFGHGDFSQKISRLGKHTAGDFNGDIPAVVVFAVNLMDGMSDILAEKTDGSLGYVIAVRDDIIYLAYMV